MGSSSKVAVICATQGLLDKLDNNEELEGVLAHELSHVAHKDVAVMTIASTGALSGKRKSPAARRSSGL